MMQIEDQKLPRCASLLLLGSLVLGCAAQNRPLQLIAGAGQVYPESAMQQGVEGFVTVEYDVDIDGRVVGARVIASEPAGVFDEAALAAVRSWRFNARMVDGVRQASTGLQSTLTFRLGEGEAYDRY